jgi:hypothetical protein
MAKDRVRLKETVAVAVAVPTVPVEVSPLAGTAVLVCLGCGKVLCEPYPTSQEAPDVTACHGSAREDYAPSVRYDEDRRAATGEAFAIAGEPMAHVRARLKG